MEESVQELQAIMKREEYAQYAQAIKQFAEENNYSFREGYSGRGMYGKECVGVRIDGVDPTSVAMDLLLWITDNYDVDTHDAIRALQNVRTDDMGRGTIVYWPDINF